MTEPAYSAEDLRIAKEIHKSLNEDGCGFFGGGKQCLDCETVAAEFAKVRRERDQAAKKLAEALRKALLDENGEMQPMNQDEQGGCVWCGRQGKHSIYASDAPRDHTPDCGWIVGKAALAEYERIAHEGE